MSTGCGFVIEAVDRHDQDYCYAYKSLRPACLRHAVERKKNVERAEFLPVLQREQNDSQNEINMWIAIVFQTE